MTKRYKKWPRLNCDSSCPRLSKALPFWVLQVVQAIRKKTMHLKQKGPGIIEFNQQHWVPTGLFLRLNALWNRYIYIYMYIRMCIDSKCWPDWILENLWVFSASETAAASEISSASCPSRFPENSHHGSFMDSWIPWKLYRCNSLW